jgi:hypothetical protein
LLTVYSKAAYNSQYENIEEASKESKQYEIFEKSIILNYYPTKIFNLIKDFEIIEKSNEN